MPDTYIKKCFILAEQYKVILSSCTKTEKRVPYVTKINQDIIMEMYNNDKNKITTTVKIRIQRQNEKTLKTI